MFNSIRDVSVKNKDVVVRSDLNVPFKNGKILDTSRIIESIPTLKLILRRKGRPIILSHFGRPKGNFNTSLSLKNILPCLIEYLGENVVFCDSLEQQEITNFISKCSPKVPILIENTRFFDGEEGNSILTSKMFSNLGDLFCNDAFSSCHRAHASTVGIAKEIPSVSGLLLEKEIFALESTLANPTPPIVAIVGGAKIETKITLLISLVKLVDHLIIGGGMANTFLFANNKEIGRSIYEKDKARLIKKIYNQAKIFNCNIHLPLDLVCAPGLDTTESTSIHDADNCPSNQMILDAGPKTILHIRSILENCSTLIWNGPLGAFETPPYDNATNKTAKLAARLTKAKKLKSVAGGGDTISALKSSSVFNDFTYISNAGGAFLEWLERKPLPGLNVLEGNALS